MANSLQAALDRSTRELASPVAPATKPAKAARPSPKARKPSRENTVLIGAHFPPEVQKQLRLIAAEEGTTNRALIEEALNLLFRKKGKALIL